MQVSPIIRELPPSYIAGIGLICFEWALQERAFRVITYELLNLGPKQGRVAVRSPRDEEQITMIKQLMGLEKITVDTVDLDGLAESIKALSKARDLVAHGIWLKSKSGELMIQDLAGNWRPDPKGPKVPRRIVPAGVIVREDDLQQLAATIRQTVALTEKAGREIREKLQASRKKNQPSPPEDSPEGDRGSGTP